MMPPSQPPYPQPQYPQEQYGPPPMPVGPRNFFNKGVIMMLVLIGIVMFFVGLMILSATGMVKPPSGSSSDYDSYRDTIRNMSGAGRLVIEVGGLLACIGLVCGGIVAEDLTDKIRAVMVSAGVAFIVTTLVVLGLFGSPWTLY